jgi:hypothetical protein
MSNFKKTLRSKSKVVENGKVDKLIKGKANAAFKKPQKAKKINISALNKRENCSQLI